MKLEMTSSVLFDSLLGKFKYIILHEIAKQIPKKFTILFFQMQPLKFETFIIMEIHIF